MNLNCNPKCKQITTSGALDPETNNVICNKCGDILTNVSDYTKTIMRQNKDVIIKTKKAFEFKCRACGKDVETEIINGVPKGKGCHNECMINISEIMVGAIQQLPKEKE